MKALRAAAALAAVAVLPVTGMATMPAAAVSGPMAAAPPASAAAAAGAGAGGGSTSGDFDGDGFDDLAVAAPFEDVGSLDGAGNVTIAFGTPTGIDPSRAEVVRPGLGMPGTPEAYEHFGMAIAVGDFDGDGFDDLAAGIPNESLGSAYGAGSVAVVHGWSGGLAGGASRTFRQGVAPVGGLAEPSDEFGAALATGDVNADGFDDLAVGARGESLGDVWSTGNVTVLYGGPSGLGSRAVTVRQGLNGLVGTPEASDRFGETVVVADLDGDGFDDLAAGAPYEAVGDAWVAGNVTIVPGSASGLVPADGRVLNAGSVACGCVQEAAAFGWALAAGDVNVDGIADLAVGAPFWEHGTVQSAGNVTVVFGTPGSDDPSQTLDQRNAGLALEHDDRFGMALATGPGADGVTDLYVGAPGESARRLHAAGLVVRFDGAREFPGASRHFHQGQLAGRAEAYDEFGAAMAVGDFSGDGVADLAVAAPGETIGVRGAGNVVVVDGATTMARAYNQASFGGTLEAYDAFGWAVA